MYHNMSYQSEVEVEPRDMAGEQSYSKAEAKGSDKLSMHDTLLEQILSKANMNNADKRVKDSACRAGIYKMKTEELLGHLKEHGGALLEDKSAGRYRPQAVKQVEIPKPDGGKRGLGIPTVVDRVI